MGERFFPRHKNVADLRSALSGMNGKSGAGIGSAGASSSDGSPEQQGGASGSSGLGGSGVANLSGAVGNHEDSLLWSAGGVLNGSRREAGAASRHDTPVRANVSFLPADRLGFFSSISW